MSVQDDKKNLSFKVSGEELLFQVENYSSIRGLVSTGQNRLRRWLRSGYSRVFSRIALQVGSMQRLKKLVRDGFCENGLAGDRRGDFRNISAHKSPP